MIIRERERLMMMKQEALEKSKQYSQMNKQSNKFKYIVLNGNNSKIVKDCLKLRASKWEETEAYDTLFNFKWNCISRGIKFD